MKLVGILGHEPPNLKMGLELLEIVFKVAFRNTEFPQLEIEIPEDRGSGLYAKITANSLTEVEVAWGVVKLDNIRELLANQHKDTPIDAVGLWEAADSKAIRTELLRLQSAAVSAGQKFDAFAHANYCFDTIMSLFKCKHSEVKTYYHELPQEDEDGNLRYDND